MRLMLDAEKCTGCKIGELACSATHAGMFNPEQSHLKIISNNTKASLRKELNACNLCLECVNACPVGAIVQEADHLTISTEQCTSCGQCVEACP